MNGLHGNTGKYFRILVGIVMLGAMLLAAGCRENGDSVVRQENLPVNDDPWPLGDGSSWCNVMEAGFHSPELPSSGWLADTGVLDLPSDQEFDTGDSPIVAGMFCSNGFSRLMQFSGSPGSDPHVALRDRFWIEYRDSPPWNTPGKCGSGQARTHFTGGGTGRGVGHFGNLSPRHFWVYF